VLLPLYLQNLMGYTAFWAGLVLGPGGIAAFFIMPLAGLMMKKKVNPRLLLAIITAALVPLTIFFRQKSAVVLSESLH
jgi:MFS transporter, DHA2 family, multidrug resistance protein